MSDMSEAIESLDYTMPPPGYRTRKRYCWQWVRDDGVVGAGEWDNEDVATAAAWAHYKREHDPPGVLTFGPLGPNQSWLWTLLSGASHAESWAGDQAQARAAAWAWHDRRLALAERDGNILLWSAYLSMTDDEVTFAEANPPVIIARDEDPEVGALSDAHARDKAAMERHQQRG